MQLWNSQLRYMRCENGDDGETDGTSGGGGGVEDKSYFLKETARICFLVLEC